jgi:hypothetical protein
MLNPGLNVALKRRVSHSKGKILSFVRDRLIQNLSLDSIRADYKFAV